MYKLYVYVRSMCVVYDLYIYISSKCSSGYVILYGFRFRVDSVRIRNLYVRGYASVIYRFEVECVCTCDVVYI